MKKKIIALVIVLALSFSFLVGCGLVVENQKRDLDQIVATVGDSNIRKGELVNAVATYGPEYIKTYGLSIKEAVDLIMEQLIKRELEVNEAIENCAISGKSVNDSFIQLDKETKDSVIAQEYKAKIEKMLTCFTDEEFKKIESKTWKDLNSIIETLENEAVSNDKDLILDKEQREEQDKYIKENSFEDRKTRPSFKKDDEKIEDYPELFFKEKVYRNITSTDTGKNYPEVDANGKAVNSVQVEAYDMFTKKVKSLQETSVQEFMLKVIVKYMESDLLLKYQDKIEAAAEAQYDGAAGEDLMMAEINKTYKNMIAQQEEKYKIDLDAFDTILNSNDRNTLTIYNAKGGYAEVKNLLIMFDGDVKSTIEGLKTDSYVSESDYRAARDQYASQLTLKDLRSQKKLNPAFNPKLKQTDKDKKDEYYLSADYVKGLNDRFIPNKDIDSFMPIESDPITFEDGKTEIATLLGGNADFGKLKTYMANSMRVMTGEKDADDIYKYAKKPEDMVDKSLNKYEDAFIDLMYKFNEDTGMFDKANPNYMVNILDKIGKKSTYVPEFQEACEKLINDAIANQAKEENPSVDKINLEDRMEVVVTDYGVHVILLTNLFFKGEYTNVPTKDDLYIENTITYNLANIIRKNVSSKAFEEEVDRVYAKAKEDNIITVYEDVYKDVANI